MRLTMKIKLFRNLLSITLTAGLIVGCSDKNSLDVGGKETPEKSPILLSSGVDVTPKTKALQDKQIAQDQTLSFFVTETSELTNVLYNNELITANGNGGFSYSQVMYYPITGENVDFYAVHPNTSGASLSTPLTFTVQADQSTAKNLLQSDLLYATKTNVARTSQKVPMVFAHKLVMLDFTIKAGPGVDLATMNNVTVTGVKPTAQLNIADGTLGVATGESIDVKAYGVRGTTEAETELLGVSAIVIPQSIASGQKLFKITIGEVDYFYTTAAEQVFEAGKKYNLELTIKQAGIDVSSTITDWGDGGSIIGDGHAED